jgi:acylphosphatase
MYIYHYKISWVRFDSRVATVAMPSGISGFMVLQNVEDLSDDAPAEADSKSTTKAPKAKTKGKPSKSSEAKVEKSEVSKPTVPTHEESKKKIPQHQSGPLPELKLGFPTPVKAP